LEQLLEDGVIDEVLGRLKSGKEADVWLVRHREEVLAAKVYKDRHQRSFKNNAGYKEGRSVRNSRTQRAIERGSKFGQAAAEDAWKSAESDALHRLHAEGVRVPAPVLFYEGILLMKLVLDAQGHPALRLIDVSMTAEEAARAYADLRQQAVRMLCCDLIHGDLSPYNVLLGAEGPTIIDFPQVVSAAHNSTAESFFNRDVENLRTFFAGFDPALRAREGDAAEIWRAYVRRELAPDFVPSGRPPEPRKDRPRHNQQPKPHDAPRQPGQGGQRPPGHGQRPQQQHGSRPHHGTQPAQHAPRPHPHHGTQPEQHAPRPHPRHGTQPAQHAQQPHPSHGTPPAQQGPRPHPQHGAPPAQHGRPPQQHPPRPPAPGHAAHGPQRHPQRAGGRPPKGQPRHGGHRRDQRGRTQPIVERVPPGPRGTPK
jgi:RIO kinase 1